MSTLTLPNGTVITRTNRGECATRHDDIDLHTISYNQGVISKITNRRADCTGLLSYLWNTPKTGPGTYLNAYNTASFYTQKLLVQISWQEIMPWDTIGFFSPSSPGNGGHAAIYLGTRSDGALHVWDHGSGLGPKDRWVKWDGISTGWLHPDHLRPWRYVGMTEDDGTTYLPGQSVVESSDMYCKFSDNSNNVETLQWTLLRVFGINLGTSGPNGNGVDRQYGNRVAAGLAKVLGRSDGTAVVDGVTVPVLKVYGPNEVSDLADKGAVKRADEAVEDAPPPPPSGGVTEEEAAQIADSVARELITGTTLAPPAP